MTELAKLRDKYEVIGDVRGKGLMIGVEMVKDKVYLACRHILLPSHVGTMCSTEPPWGTRCSGAQLTTEQQQPSVTEEGENSCSRWHTDGKSFTQVFCYRFCVKEGPFKKNKQQLPSFFNQIFKNFRFGMTKKYGKITNNKYKTMTTGRCHPFFCPIGTISCCTMLFGIIYKIQTFNNSICMTACHQNQC